MRLVGFCDSCGGIDATFVNGITVKMTIKGMLQSISAYTAMPSLKVVGECLEKVLSC